MIVPIPAVLSLTQIPILYSPLSLSSSGFTQAVHSEFSRRYTISSVLPLHAETISDICSLLSISVPSIFNIMSLTCIPASFAGFFEPFSVIISFVPTITTPLVKNLTPKLSPPTASLSGILIVDDALTCAAFVV